MAVRGGQVLLFLAALEPQSSKSCPALNDTASPLQPHTSRQRLLAASPHRWSPRNRVSLRHSRAPRSQAHDQLTALAGGLGKAAGGGGGLEPIRGLASTAIPVRHVQPSVPLARNAYFAQNGGSDWPEGRSVAVHCTRTPSAAPKRAPCRPAVLHVERMAEVVRVRALGRRLKWHARSRLAIGR
jgi:hypothetical protein